MMHGQTSSKIMCKTLVIFIYLFPSIHSHKMGVFLKGFYCAIDSYNTQRVYNCTIHQLEVRWKHSFRVNGERYEGSKSSGSEEMHNTMEKTLHPEDMGGGDLKENVFGTFMNVFFVLPVKIT